MAHETPKPVTGGRDEESTPAMGGGCDADPQAKVDVRQLPRLIREGLGIIRAAARRDFIFLLILQVIGGVDLFAVLVLGREGLDTLLDNLRRGGTLTSIVPWALVLAGFIAFHMFVNALQRERQELVGELVTRHIEERILEVTTAVELVAFDTPDFHNRVQRIQKERHRPMQLVWGLTGLAQGAIGVGGVVIAFIAVAPLVIPLLALVAIPVWLGASRRSQLLYRFVWKMTPRDRERAYLYDVLVGREEAKEVRAFGTAEYLWARYRRLYEERITELRRVARRSTIYAVLSGLGMGVVLSAMLLVVVWLTLRGDLKLADTGIAVAGVGVLGGRLASAGFSAGSLSEAALYLDDYRHFLALGPRYSDGALVRFRPHATTHTDGNGTGAPIPVDGNRAPPTTPGFQLLELESLTFTYPTGERPVLTDVSMSIRAGEVVALVGENGSGKTTLSKLLARLHLPQSGTIRWDGVDITAMDPDALRKQMAVIFQDFLHYHLPARDNVGLGRWEAMEDLESIQESARQAGAHDFVIQLEKQYETWLGPEFEGGTDLSTGQWQRIALARAFFRDAPFVILDEPTAALDARAEHELFKRIRTLLAGRTVLLISHRFSSVRSADRIYVLHEGRIIESWSHEELLRLDGRYAELFNLQAASYLDVPVTPIRE